ncbi:hypothetical protein [Serpentinimonas maccroryi]|uniref:hypothetical protein n=1 Tax=Serpentinimonas maccroryi TaxID=1458426 RepID=UPI001186B6D0|nr:hypothetical protein [Serpentinimonas maccroryi]MCM2478212.1 hypothetical protein [Serpentinimonas maccroryi]
MIVNNAGLLAAAARRLQGPDYRPAQRCGVPSGPVDKFVGNDLADLHLSGFDAAIFFSSLANFFKSCFESKG